MRWNLLAAAVALVMAGSAEAAILFDFGPAGATLNPTNSPGHAAGAVTGGSTWNRVSLANLASGIVNNNGTAATGVSLTYGIAAAGVTTVTYGVQPGSTISGGGTAGVYAVSSPVRTGVFNNSNNSILGLRIDGLAAGQYDVYTASRNTQSSAAGTTTRVFYGTSALGSTFATAGAGSLDQSNAQGVTTAGTNASFVLGNQYQKFTVTVSASNPSLYLAFRGVATELRPFVNSVELVAIPEPVAAGLVGLTGAGVLLRRRRG